MSIAICGSIAFDSVETPQGKRERVLGGSASYAGTAASIFSPCDILSIVGQDFPQEYFDYFTSRKINTDGVEISEGKTFFWEGYYEKDMGQAYTRKTELNVLLKLNPVVPENTRNAEIVFMGNTDPVIQRKTIQQFKNPRLVILDTMNFWIENSNEELCQALKLVDILIVNDQEVRMLTKTDNIIQALPRLLEMGPKQIIVKKGEHGALMFNGTNYFLFPAVPLFDITDPTGAGDSFAGGFIGALAGTALKESDYQKAMIIGTLVASFTVQDFSLDKLKTITKQDLEDVYQRLKTSISYPEVLFSKTLKLQH